MPQSDRLGWNQWPGHLPGDWPDADLPGFVVLDIETTGLSPYSDRVVEIGLVRVGLDGLPVGSWSSLVNPQQEIGASEVHGISDLDVIDAPIFDELVDEVLARIRGVPIVAHNASFDSSFLSVELARSGWEIPELRTICTMIESSHFLPGLSRKRLADCIDAIGFDGEVTHRALGDATLASALLFFYLNGPMNPDRSEFLRNIPLEASPIEWPDSKTFPAVPEARHTRQIFHVKPRPISAVANRISNVMPEDLLDESAESAELSYCACLLEVIEDGDIDPGEHENLADLGISLGLAQSQIVSIHQRLLAALAFEAWFDGVVNRAEKREVEHLAIQLGLSAAEAAAELDKVEALRASRIASRSEPVPVDWRLGEPLYVGDRVVFTGCYDFGRDEMESNARRMGLRVTGSVSGRTDLLVSDGTINGNKDRSAASLGIRTVRPEVFLDLLRYVQPREQKPLPEPQNTRESKGRSEPHPTFERGEEMLRCVTCGQNFSRPVSRGRKPHNCPVCRIS